MWHLQCTPSSFAALAAESAAVDGGEASRRSRWSSTAVRLVLSLWGLYSGSSLRRTWWVCRPCGLCSLHTCLSSHPSLHPAAALSIWLFFFFFFSVGKCSIFEGSHGYCCEAGVSLPLQRLSQSEQLAFSFSGRRHILLSPGEKDACPWAFSWHPLYVLTPDTVQAVSDKPGIILPIASF